MPSTQFEAAAAYLSSSPSLNKVSNTVKLELYGLFKTTTIGPSPTSSRPSIFDMTGRAKWDAWNAAGRRYPEVENAEARYIEIARELGWTEIKNSLPIKPQGSDVEEKSSEGKEGDVWDTEGETSANGGGGLGLSVSTMAHTKEASERTLHGFAVDNDVKGIEELLTIVPDLDLDELDEHGYTSLHLAADRGHLDVVKLLLSKGVDKFIKDPDDMTAIELARIVGHNEIVVTLSG